jgi:hypothetical protein
MISTTPTITIVVYVLAKPSVSSLRSSNAPLWQPTLQFTFMDSHFCNSCIVIVSLVQSEEALQAVMQFAWRVWRWNDSSSIITAKSFMMPTSAFFIVNLFRISKRIEIGFFIQAIWGFYSTELSFYAVTLALALILYKIFCQKIINMDSVSNYSLVK